MMLGDSIDSKKIRIIIVMAIILLIAGGLAYTFGTIFIIELPFL